MSDNITLPRWVAQLTLDALEWTWGGEPMGEKELAEITALRTALAAPPPEPAAVVCTQADAWKLIGSKWVPPGMPFKAVHMLRDLPLGTPLYAAPPALAAPPEDIEALRQDAERYRWLRNRACHGPHERFVSEYGWFDVSGQHEPGFDGTIDAAMKEDKR